MLELVQHFLHEGDDFACSLGACALGVGWHGGGRSGFGARVSLGRTREARRGLALRSSCRVGGWYGSAVVPHGNVDVGFPIARGARGAE